MTELVSTGGGSIGKGGTKRFEGEGTEDGLKKRLLVGGAWDADSGGCAAKREAAGALVVDAGCAVKREDAGALVVDAGCAAKREEAWPLVSTSEVRLDFDGWDVNSAAACAWISWSDARADLLNGESAV